MIRKPRIDSFGHVHPPRRTIPLRFLVSVAVLLAVSLSTARWVDRFVTSLETYAPPAMSQLAAGNGTTPAAQRIVLIIVSGLREDASQEMPTLRSLRRQGAYAQVHAPWSTTSHATWTTLLSGATPELSGAVTLNALDEEPRPINVDHLLRRARVTRRTTALAGQQRWESMIPVSALNEVVVSAGTAIEDDARLVQQAVDTLASKRPDLMVVQLSHLDTVGRLYGGISDEYFRATLRVDELIRKLALTIDLQSTVLAITSDHGHLDQGGSGGSEPAVATVPFLIAGPGIQPGDYGVINQTDIAPTLSALVGLPIPAASQGQIRFEMLSVSDPLLAEKALALAEQQVRLSDAYLQAIDWGGATGAPMQTLDVALSAWAINNVQGAFEIARQSEQDARQEMAAGRAARIADERRKRLWVALVVGVAGLIGVLWSLSLRSAWLLGASLLAWLGPLGRANTLATITDTPALRWSPAMAGAILATAAAVWAWRSRRRERWVIAVAALGIGLLFATTQAGTFSLSTAGSVETLRAAMVRGTIGALLIGGAAVLGLMWPAEPDPGPMSKTSYWFVLLLTAGLVLELAVGYWLVGPQVTWYLPDVDFVFWQLTSRMQIMLVAGLGILLPAVVIPAALLLDRLRKKRPLGAHAQASEVEGIRL